MDGGEELASELNMDWWVPESESMQEGMIEDANGKSLGNKKKNKKKKKKKKKKCEKLIGEDSELKEKKK